MNTETLENYLHKIAFAVVAIATLAASVFYVNDYLKPASADNPTFFFSTSTACGGPLTEAEVAVNQELTLYICIDADNEGAGLLGSETHIAYDTTYLNAVNVECNVFDTCIDLSESGSIKLLAASGPLGEGRPATMQEHLGTIEIEPLQMGTTNLSFTSVQVINQDQEVENRSGIGITINIGEAAEELPCDPETEECPEEPCDPETEECPEETEEPVEEEPVEEEEPEPEPESTPVLDRVRANPVSATAAPGEQVQIISGADYTEGRSSENITSCFPCPTAGNTEANGRVTYTVLSGPGYFSGSRVIVTEDAANGALISFRVGYEDFISGTTATSATRSIVVSVPTPEPAEEEPAEEEPAEEEPAEEEPEEEPVEVEEPTEPEVLGEIHESAAEYAKEAEVAVAKPLQESSDLEIPARPKDDFCMENFSGSLDSDSDGLSDRTECYIKTNYEDVDTDQDTCWDGDEVNRFYTNPLRVDCNISNVTQQSVIITDPKPGWTVRKLDIWGIAPRETESVGVTAFPSIHSTLNPVIEGMEALEETLATELPEDDPETEDIDEYEEARDVLLTEIETGSQEISDLIPALLSFIDEYPEYDYDAEKEIAESIEEKVAPPPNTLFEEKDDVTTLLEALEEHRTQAIFLGETRGLEPAATGGRQTASFNVIPAEDIGIVDNELYDLVATAVFPNNSTLSSAPIRVSVDSDLAVDNPIPESIDGVPVDAEVVEIYDIEVEGATEIRRKGASYEIVISNERPVVTGNTVYGAQVFATWESVVLTSSIVADSQEGSFAIQAPQALTKNEPHKLTLYAILEDDEIGKVRSDSVSINFIVKTADYSWYLYLMLLLLIILLAILVARRKMRKIDQLPPEHRATEDELYDAFNGEHHHKNRKQAKKHKAKQKEVKKAFEKGALKHNADKDTNKPDESESDSGETHLVSDR